MHNPEVPQELVKAKEIAVLCRKQVKENLRTGKVSLSWTDMLKSVNEAFLAESFPGQDFVIMRKGWRKYIKGL